MLEKYGVEVTYGTKESRVKEIVEQLERDMEELGRQREMEPPSLDGSDWKEIIYVESSGDTIVIRDIQLDGQNYPRMFQ